MTNRASTGATRRPSAASSWSSRCCAASSRRSTSCSIFSAIGLAVPSLTKAWSMPPAAFTQAFALSSVGIMAGAMLAGPIADRFGRKPVLLFSVALLALSRCSGVGALAADPGGAALLHRHQHRRRHADDGGVTSDYTPDRWRTSAVMFMFTGNTIGGFFAGQIAAQILPRWGWQGIFYVGGIVPLVLLVVLIFILPEIAAVPARRAAGRC